MVTRRTFATAVILLGISFAALAVGVLILVANITHRSNLRNDQSNITASEQASTRLLVCTGLEALPQTAGVRALEAIGYPVYGKPTTHYCPAPMPGATK